MKQIKVTSDDLHDGRWNPSISNTSVGVNASPDLKWDCVEGAEEYAIYMIDEYDTDNWLHWKAFGIKTAGAIHKVGFKEKVHSEYVGPYPPSGIHPYTIYVFALKEPALRYPGKFNSRSVAIDMIKGELDQSVNGKTGNILAEGKIKGTFEAV